MNQNQPPAPGGDERGGHDTPSFASAQDPDAGRSAYYGGRRADEPDLDAEAPVLRSSDVQRLNRRALVFLAGIVALLVAMTWWLLGRGSDEPERQGPERQQAVVVPELPETNPVLPIETMPDAAELAVPPLPVESDGPVEGVEGGEDARQGPTLVERRITGLEGAGNGGSSAQRPRQESGADTSAQHLRSPDALLVRGTYLRCVLETRIVTDVPGFTSCVVTEPVYSINGKSLLLPKGSKILGRYDTAAETDRVAVVWDRVITPDGVDVSMASPGVDGLGGAGHPGDLDNHWGSKIASALLISLISDAFSWAAAEYGPESTATFVGPGGATVVEQPFESATARSMERLANQALMKSANRPPTVTINQGAVVNVYVAQDVDFSNVLALR